MTTALPQSADVIVVGGGNAAFCAALAAAEQGVSVLVLERAPEDEAGGNSRFTAGAFRCVYDGVEDLRKLMPDLSDEAILIDICINNFFKCSSAKTFIERLSCNIDMDFREHDCSIISHWLPTVSASLIMTA